jgi:hypothetical protein
VGRCPGEPLWNDFGRPYDGEGWLCIGPKRVFRPGREDNLEMRALKLSLIVRLLCLTVSLVALAGIFSLGRRAAQIEEPAAMLRVVVTLAAMSLMAGLALILFTTGASRRHLVMYGLFAVGVLAACALARRPFIMIGGPALLLVVPLVFTLSLGWPDESYDDDH